MVWKLAGAVVLLWCCCAAAFAPAQPSHLALCRAQEARRADHLADDMGRFRVGCG